MEAGGGAWCPREMVYHEGLQYLEVNLGAPHVVTKVEVQGRFGNGQGREFARQYKLQIWRPNMAHWATYNDGRGKEVGRVRHTGSSGQWWRCAAAATCMVGLRVHCNVTFSWPCLH